MLQTLSGGRTTYLTTSSLPSRTTATIASIAQEGERHPRLVACLAVGESVSTEMLSLAKPTADAAHVNLQIQHSSLLRNEEAHGMLVMPAMPKMKHGRHPAF